jgi:hypothetical protein
MHGENRTMRVEHLVAASARLGGGVLIVAALVHLAESQAPRRDAAPRVSQSSDIHLAASINRERNQIDVALRNDGGGTYLVPLGSLFPSSRFQRLRFELSRSGKEAEPLVISFDEPGVVSGNGGSWVAVFTPGSQFDFTFPLQSLRLFRRIRTSVADLHGPYTLRIDFAGLDPNSEPDIAFVRNWPQKQLNATIPFWRGKLTVEVAD